jgi:cytoskeletal protein RodZ
MKTVGKQLQEARLARNWTPELAARETKIKVDRLRDLEADDYSHFASPTYARGFVRTYARSLGLDEYRILRQLDNKLPDDDAANMVTETGVAYLPETAMPPRAAHRDYTGLYIVMGLGAVVTLAIVFVLFEAYRVGELANWFESSPEPVVAAGTSATNANGAPASPTAETTARALPVDSNTPPPIVDTTSMTNITNMTNMVNGTNAIADATPGAPGATIPPRALPVDPSELTNAAPGTPVAAQATASDTSSSPATNVPPRALPVDPSELAMNTPPPANESNGVIPPVAPPAPITPSSAPQSNSGSVVPPSLPPIAPSTGPAPVAPAAPAAPTVSEAATNAATNAAPPTAADSAKRLVLTASQDSFVRITDLDAPDADKPLYAAVLRSGQSVGFDGHKFSINVGIPSAVDIKLDGVNYGPHSDQQEPETFTVESHLP